MRHTTNCGWEEEWRRGGGGGGGNLEREGEVICLCNVLIVSKPESL